MKKVKSAIILLLAMTLALSIPVQAASTSKEKAAIKKQIALIYDGIKTQNPSKMKKVIKQWYCYSYNPKEYEKAIGKAFIKEFTPDTTYKINKIKVKGKKATVTISTNYWDASSYYYLVKNRIYLEDKDTMANFNEEFLKTRASIKKANPEDVWFISAVSSKYSFEMVKKKGKWVIEEDPDGYFFNIYTVGYRNLAYNYWRWSW